MSYWTAFGLGILSSHLFWCAVGGLLFWLGKLTNHAPEPRVSSLRRAIREGLDQVDFDCKDGCPYGSEPDDFERFLADVLTEYVVRAAGEA